jgi:hypothetical protein
VWNIFSFPEYSKFSWDYPFKLYFNNSSRIPTLADLRQFSFLSQTNILTKDCTKTNLEDDAEEPCE